MSLIALMMESESTSETSVDCETILRNITEGWDDLHTRSRDNLKSHTIKDSNINRSSSVQMKQAYPWAEDAKRCNCDSTTGSRDQQRVQE